MFAVYPIDTEHKCFVRRKCRVAAANPDKYECQYCHRTFAKQYNLLIHERIHKDENENTLNGLHPCDICGKVFGKAESLKNHRAGHSPPAVPKELKGFLVECVTY